MQEEYKLIEEFPDYYVSNLGNIASIKSGEWTALKPWLDSQGRYYMVTLCKDSKPYKKLVHRLVGQYFVPNPDNKPVINHKDHDTHNNNSENLEWVTVQENIHHSYSTMNQVRNVKKRILVFPDGSKMEFPSYTAIQRYRDEHNLPFGKYALNYYGHSAGYTLITLDCK